MREDKTFSFLNGSIEPMTIIKDVLKQWLVILLLAVGISRLVFVAVDLTYVPEYTSSGTYVVSQRSSAYAYGDLNAARATAENMGQILESSVLHKKVCEELGLSFFPGTVTVSTIPETNMMTVSMTAPTPELAYKLLVAVMENYTIVSDYLLGDVVMQQLEAPVVPTGASNYVDAYTPKQKAFEYTAILLIVLFALNSILKDTVRTEKDAKNKIDGHFLGSIAHEFRYKTLTSMIKRPKTSILVTNPSSSFRYVETMRKLGMKVKNAMDDRDAKVLLVSSVQENEGKSTVAANIALVLAQEAEKVLLVDCDFRKPAQYKIFEKDRKSFREVGHVIANSDSDKEYIQFDEKNGLYFALGSKDFRNSTEMVGSEEFRSLVDEWKKQMDYIILDTSPMALVPDAEEIADVADASLLVVRQHRAQAIEINDAIDVLENSRSSYIGFILNNLFDSVGTVAQFGYGAGYGHSYGYGYGYGSYGSYGHYGSRGGSKDAADQ